MDFAGLLDRVERRLFPVAGGIVGALGRLARRGGLAASAEPRRRRLVLLQIDGLSGRRLERELASGTMPHLLRRISDGKLRVRRVRAATVPSTPVFQAGLLYGSTDGLPGFGWYDRGLGRTVRMDVAEDIAAFEGALGRGHGTPLLDGGSSYGTIWPGGASEEFFNVLRWGRDSTVHTTHPKRGAARSLHSDVFDLAASLATVGFIGARLAGRALGEMASGAVDLWRFARRHHTTRFEWRFWYMRLFVNVILRDTATHHAVLDVLRGTPVIYIDYLDYDECAHRRGPDSPVALLNLRGIDAAVERLARAIDEVPEYGYELYILSDHGQSETLPFERVVGEELEPFVLARVSDGATAEDVHEVLRLRQSEASMRSERSSLRALVSPWIARRRRALERKLGPVWGALEPVQVVTGGSIAHVYLGRDGDKLAIEEIERRWPRLVDELSSCRAVGLMVARGQDGPVVYYRGRRYAIDDRARLSSLAPFRALGWELLSAHLQAAAACERSGDLVLYGAFSPSGNVAFDFELGSHGGVHPDELDQFFIHPAHVEVALESELRADALHRFFQDRCADGRHAA